VKAIPPSTVLLTGLSLGKTTVRTWNQNEKEDAFDVIVVPFESVSEDPNQGRGQVARVSLQFLELNEAIGRASGIQWPDSLTFSAGGALQGVLDPQAINYSLSFSSAGGFLHLLIKEGWARIRAKPELYVRLGEQAVFHSGGEFPVSTGIESFGRVQKRIDWKKYGLTARVKPDSADQIHFQTDIQLEISEMDHSYQVDNVPSLTHRNFTTKMDSLDGETVILSGLTRQSTQEEESRPPLLGEIPVLGSLFFTKKSNGSKETEILMAVTIEMTTRAQEQETIKAFQQQFKK